MDRPNARRSFPYLPEPKGRPLKPATVALRYRITDPQPRLQSARPKPIGALTPVKARGEEQPAMPLIGRAGDTCGVRIPGPEYPLVPGRLRAPAARNFIAPVKKALRMYTLKLPGGIAARRLSLASAILMAG